MLTAPVLHAIAAFGLLVLAYLLGSLPTGYLAGRWLKGIDIREEGSGGTGTTNVLRILGKGPAVVVLIVDVLKGVAAVLLVRLVWQKAGLDLNTASQARDWLIALAALVAVFGHSRPVWLGFRGGKSVATGLGVLLAMQWPVALAALGTFALVLAVSRIVSLASLLAVGVMAIAMFLSGASLPYLLFALLGAGFVIWRHRSNVERLLAGTEPKIGQSAASS
jgi:acyl phosphate:glycerol-3-phosphate acyltransferase